MTASHNTTTAESQYLSADEFLRRHRGLIARTLFYESVQRGEIPHLRVGRRILVPHDALDRMLAAQHPETRELATA